MAPMGDWTEKRLKRLSGADQSRDTSKVGSGFGKNVSNWVKMRPITQREIVDYVEANIHTVIYEIAKISNSWYNSPHSWKLAPHCSNFRQGAPKNG